MSKDPHSAHSAFINHIAMSKSSKEAITFIKREPHAGQACVGIPRRSSTGSESLIQNTVLKKAVQARTKVREEVG